MYMLWQSLWYWSCEKMIHAYASIWRCSMHDIIIEIREKNMCARSSPWNKHTRVEMETIVSHYTENIWKVKKGSGGASPPPPPPPEANIIKTRQIKWKFLLFDESDLFGSPEPLGWQGELIVYHSSRRPSVCTSVRRSQFQTSFSLKPMNRSKPNFTWSLLG